MSWKDIPIQKREVYKLRRNSRTKNKFTQFVQDSGTKEIGSEILVVYYKLQYPSFTIGEYVKAYKVNQRGMIQEIPVDRFPAVFSKDFRNW